MKNLYKKTYGVEGLIDWQAEIKAGKAKMVVNFTGGGLTSFGVTPATFTTKNILHQHIIENSSFFKRGKIKLMRTVPLHTEEEKKTLVETPAKEYIDVDTVANCADARNWLREHKNISLGAKTKAEIIEIAAAQGVRFPNLMK